MKGNFCWGSLESRSRSGGGGGGSLIRVTNSHRIIAPTLVPGADLYPARMRHALGWDGTKRKQFVTEASTVVPHQSTNSAQPCLTSAC